jgi:hypothetical protein
MTPSIEMKPLSRGRRKLIFGLSVFLFMVAVPVSVFYAIGYRFDFTGTLTTIKSVGGMYVRSDAENTEMFINDEPVEDMRVFQRAAYIQNLEAGMHRIHVQGQGLQTWVKELPVYAHYVTEVASFNLPSIPQIRILTQWSDPTTGEGILFNQATTTVFSFASTTNQLKFATSTATSTYVQNAEYLYIESLFASSTEIETALARQAQQAERNRFTFDVPTSTQNVIVATTTKNWRDFSLYQGGEDVYISWQGQEDKIPYYYCIEYRGEKMTTEEYGAHVFDALQIQFASAIEAVPHEGERVCRESIRIDRQNSEVALFDFFPDSTDIILMLLEDGLYAVEVDDRAWQNSQLLYPGTDLNVIQDSGRIFVQDGEYYLEVFTEIAPLQ